MLRDDGMLRVYMIQVKTPCPEFEETDGWTFPSLRPGAYGPLETIGSMATCHLPEGLGGTTDINEAFAGLTEISTRWPGERFRLVLITMTQETEALAYARNGVRES